MTMPCIVAFIVLFSVEFYNERRFILGLKRKSLAKIFEICEIFMRKPCKINKCCLSFKFITKKAKLIIKMWNKLAIFVKIFWLQDLCQKDFCVKIFAKHVLRKFLRKYVQDMSKFARQHEKISCYCKFYYFNVSTYVDDFRENELFR